MSRTMSSAGCCALLALVLGTTTPLLGQTVRRDAGETPAARTSKVDAISIKQSAAGGPAYLEIDGIKGESTARRHEGAIEIVSWSWGAGGPQSNRSGSLTINKRVDGSSPQLTAAAAKRRKLGRMRLTLPPGRAGEPAQVVTLHDVLVSSIQPSGGSGTESVSFNYTKIEF
jgi:type VI secretion system secreted protein Hcp